MATAKTKTTSSLLHALVSDVSLLLLFYPSVHSHLDHFVTIYCSSLGLSYCRMLFCVRRYMQYRKRQLDILRCTNIEKEKEKKREERKGEETESSSIE